MLFILYFLKYRKGHLYAEAFFFPSLRSLIGYWCNGKYFYTYVAFHFLVIQMLAVF